MEPISQQICLCQIYEPHWKDLEWLSTRLKKAEILRKFQIRTARVSVSTDLNRTSHLRNK